MHKSKLTAITAFVLTLVLILSGCKAAGGGDKSPDSEKEMLKLVDFTKSGGVSVEATEPEIREISIPVNGLTETPTQKYEEREEMKPLTDFISEQFGIELDDRWLVTVHFTTADMTCAMVAFDYCVGEIATDRSIIFNFENSVADTVYYKLLNEEIDEEEIQSRLALFKEKYTQEKKVLEDGEELQSETTNYVYNIASDTLIYFYNLFFYYGEDRVINNDYGTSCIIDENGNAVYN